MVGKGMKSDSGGGDSGSQRTVMGKDNNDVDLVKAIPIPPCCLKARASAPELEAKCHSTVVSGWFSEPQSRSGLYSLQFIISCLELNVLVEMPKEIFTLGLLQGRRLSFTTIPCGLVHI